LELLFLHTKPYWSDPDFCLFCFPTEKKRRKKKDGGPMTGAVPISALPKNLEVLLSLLLLNGLFLFSKSANYCFHSTLMLVVYFME